MNNISGPDPGDPLAGSADPAQAAQWGVSLGDELTYDAQFDTSALVYITDAANALYGGSGTGIRVASLAAPGASFTLNFDGQDYSQDISQGVDANG